MDDFKLRTLTMKHFSTPQEKPYTGIEIDELEDKYGNYISFYHHHFLRIAPCQDNRIISAYNALCHERTEEYAGTHILQTLTLTGQEADFWEQEPALLFVTLVKMRGFEADSGTENRYQMLVKRLKELFNESVPIIPELTPSFALYYSYDFCDYVLFAKNITMERYNEILWRMTTGADCAFNAVRDTYSIYAFHTRTLLEAMKGTDTPELDALSLNISLRLSAYSSTSFSAWEESLLKYNIKLDKAFMFSRYDLELQAKNINGKQLAMLLHELDCTYAEDLPPFGSYELMLLSSVSPSNEPSGKAPWKDVEFVNALETMLASNANPVDKILQEYDREALRSLRELLQNSFSTEFLMGVFPAYLTGRDILKIDGNTPEWHQIQELYANAQYFFNALDTLKLSMMHGEHRFIQAPAFDATYFDIPPKLFAYYAAILNLTKEVYQDKDGKYTFLMVPDFRPGINVRPLPEEDAADVKSRLAIVYLSERYFYDPFKAISLIFHETAHYLSERYREERAKEIFFSISAYLIVNLPIGKLLNKDSLHAFMDRKSLLGVLAGELSEFIFQDYTQHTCYDKGIPFSFVGIQKYLQDILYGIRIISNGYTKEMLIRAWSASIMASQNIDILCNDCKEILDSLQKEVGESSFLSEMFPKKFACDILAAKVAKQIDDFSYEMDSQRQDSFYQDCENILFAFREAFADHRMIQVLKTPLTLYEELLKDTREGLEKFDFEFTLRHDAIVGIHFEGEGVRNCEPEGGENDDEVRREWLLYYTSALVILGITRYLEKCVSTDVSPDIISQIVKHTSDDAGECQLRHIHSELNKYRDCLIRNAKTSGIKSVESAKLGSQSESQRATMHS